MNNREFIERKTKILATLGPSSNTIKKIIELSKAGANAFRLNCSHLNEKDLEEYIYKIRRAEIIIKKPIGILVDLQGPKIRIGNVSNSQNILKKGDIFVLDNIKETGNNKRVYLSNKKIFNSVKKGHLILIDDGNIHLKITSITKNAIRTKVLQGGILKSNKGLNLPQSEVKTSALSSSDKKFVKIASNLNVDWIALILCSKTIGY